MTYRTVKNNLNLDIILTLYEWNDVYLEKFDSLFIMSQIEKDWKDFPRYFKVLRIVILFSTDC